LRRQQRLRDAQSLGQPDQHFSQRRRIIIHRQIEPFRFGQIQQMFQNPGAVVAMNAVGEIGGPSGRTALPSRTLSISRVRPGP
jgi:hypothetical protein